MQTIIQSFHQAPRRRRKQCGGRSGTSGAHACWLKAVKHSTAHTRSPEPRQGHQRQRRNAAAGSQGPRGRRQADPERRQACQQEARGRQRRSGSLAACRCRTFHSPNLRGNQPVHKAPRSRAAIGHHRRCEGCAAALQHPSPGPAAVRATPPACGLSRLFST